MRKLLHKLILCVCLVGSWTQVQGQTNLSVSKSTSPVAGIKTTQPLKFTVRNAGVDTVKTFTAGVIMNGVKIAEQQFNYSLAKNKTYAVVMKDSATMEYGSTNDMILYVHAENDIDASNDSMKYSFTMPTNIGYPYVWNDETSKNDFTTATIFEFNEKANGFGLTGKNTNWRGSFTSGVIPFPAGKMVSCSYNYIADHEVTVTITANYGSTTKVLYTGVLPVAAVGKKKQFSFQANGPARIVVTAKLYNVSWDTYGSFFMNEINYKDAVPDISAESILEPSVGGLVANTDGYTVKAKFANNSPYDVENPKFTFQMGSQKVTETYNSSIKAGETLDYEFVGKLLANYTDSQTLKVWSEAPADEFAGNDTVTATYGFYSALSFPYSTTFDSDNNLWSVIDAEPNGETWTVTNEVTGDMHADITVATTGTNKDYLVSPAINMPAGKSRLSFYYSSGSSATGTAHLRVLMGKSPDYSDMKEVAFDKDVTVYGWLSGYHLINLDEAGTYYFAFEATGKGSEILLDNIKVDKEEDLCIASVNFDTESGYAKNSAKVTIGYANFGVTTQKNINVRYYINQDTTPNAEETVKGSVEPGDTLYYTFTKPVDISTADSTYILIGEVATSVGSDLVNDKMEGQVLTHWASQTLPYYSDFTDQTRDVQWSYYNTADSICSWATGTSSFAYNDRYSLRHIGAVANGAADWAFSEGITVPKGRYEVSFFYRTSLNYNTDAYRQNFSLSMGAERSPEGMTIDIAKFDSITVGRYEYKKFSAIVDIPEDGCYYLGFCNTSRETKGQTFIDNISFVEPTDGYSLPYNSIFNVSDADYTKYNPRDNDPQWTLTNEGDETVEKVVRTADNQLYNNGAEGMLVTPKFALDADKAVKVSVEYALSSENTDMRFNIYGSNVNNQDSMVLLKELPIVADSAYEKVEFDIPAFAAATDYFFAFRTNAPTETSALNKSTYVYTARVKNISFEYDDLTGITTTSAADGISLYSAAGKLYVKANGAAKMDIYSLNGQCVASVSTGSSEFTYDASDLKGVYLVKVSTKDGNKIVKVTF